MTLPYNQITKAIDVGDVHVDVPLSTMSVAYMQSREEFIADKIFPNIPVPFLSNRYYTFNRDAFFRNRGRKWTPGTPMAQSMFDLDNTPTYSCQFRAFEHPLRWDIAANQDAVVNLERATAEFIAQTLLLGREVEWATTFFKDAVWGTDLTGVTSGPNSTQFYQWDNYVNSNPIEDFTKAILIIKGRTGFTPNVGIMSEQVYQKIRIHPVIKEMYKYTQVPITTPDMVANVLGLKKLYIGSAIQATSPEGAGDDNFTADWVFGKHAWIGYVPDAPSLMMPSSGYTFGFTGMGAGYQIAIQRIPDQRTMVDYTQGFMCYDQKVIGKDLGVFFKDAIA